VRKIFSILIELFQNIVKHSICINNEFCKSNYIGDGIIILKSNEIQYTISSGNYIEKKNVTLLTDLINKINSLDKQGLKKLYKERLKTDRKQNESNTGVGLIDIARKSENPIVCNIKSINQSLSFCEITVTIDKEINE
ncbi:MAG: SiaB family protein kinase, partial [bacterium]